MAYSASFTAGGILFNEFEAILPYIQQVGIKDFLQQEVRDNLYLKINTESARKRVVTELKKRIEAVNMDFWQHYAAVSAEERKKLLFFLCCKSYQLVWDFHFKVTLPGFWAYRHEADFFPYKMYLDELASKDETVNGWSESTKKKCITNYIRMLNETGIVQNGKLQKSEVEYEFYRFFINGNEPWALDIFLLNNDEKQTVLNYCK
ncbi:MAG: BrxA family protein [Ferruginibacter sp.]